MNIACFDKVLLRGNQGMGQQDKLPFHIWSCVAMIREGPTPTFVFINAFEHFATYNQGVCPTLPDLTSMNFWQSPETQSGCNFL